MDINEISPSLREFLLNRNINGNSINPYKLNSTNDLLYKTEHLQPNGVFQGGSIRKFTTTKNLYLDSEEQEIINLNTQVSLSVQKGSYLDENKSLNVGGIATQPLDIIGTVLNGQSLGVSSKGIIDSFDIRTSLAGRTLGSLGGINDTPLGIIGGQQLALALANNAAFGLQQETIGHVNTNPLSLLQGNNIIVPNYTITVPQGKFGKALAFLDRVLGFEIPVSILSVNSSIFTSENPVSNITRANEMIKNTGKGQVLALFANINANKYKPAFTDDRVKQGVNKAADGSNPELYAFDDGRGGVIDFINDVVGSDGTKINSPISQTNYDLEGLVKSSGFKGTDDLSVSFNNPFAGHGTEHGETDFIWTDDNRNYLGARELGVYNGKEFTTKKSLLFKTQEIFNTNKMKTLTTGKSILQARTMINSAIRSTLGAEYMSRGSGVIGFSSPNTPETDPDKMFCRTWTTFDQYNQVQDLQKNRGLYSEGFSYRFGSENSVLDDNGFVKIAPYKDDGKDVRNYMFSIENLAWADNLANLLDSEIGNGDGNVRGRVMWFPPYDLNVSENNSSDWDATKFIGRGEPIYNYNNAERSGTLSFKVVVDHPSYMNALTKEDNDYFASFFAGCTPMNETISSRLTTTEIQEIQQNNATVLQKKDIAPQTPPPNFTIYFENDSAAVVTIYEDGIGGGLGLTTGQGYTSANGSSFPDNTDYSLNAKQLTMNGTDYSGWTSTDFQTALTTYIQNTCPLCRINLSGYASKQGQSSANQSLSDARVSAVQTWLTSNILGTNDKLGNKRFSKVDGKGESDEMSGQCRKGNIGDIDKIGCKINRKVDVSFVFDPTLAEEAKPDATVKTTENPNINVSKKIINRFYDESKYFEKLRQEDAFVYDKIRDKIKYFHPVFHSTTPEGLNSRLNFLLQCTRQGPTLNGENADNLAFGRPPVCILRLGDFYHSKIIIDNINISYDPLVWDLNPEGVGVQPMIANVDLSFKFIGGQSLYGPINKLQNAVSFNFFANTHVYDVRADKLKKNDSPDGPSLTLVKGEQITKPVVLAVNESNLGGSGTLNTPVPTDQQSVANNQTNQETNTQADPKVIGFNIGSVSSASTNWNVVFSINTENVTTDVQRNTIINSGIKLKIVRDSNVFEYMVTNLAYFNTKNSVITIPISNIPANTKACDFTLLVGGVRIQSQNLILNG